jgi:hypothetical protein
MSKEILVNTRSGGGFAFSDKALNYYRVRTGMDLYDTTFDNWRTDPVMIDIVRKMGNRASGRVSELRIETIPEKYARHHAWKIDEYDGYESLHLLDYIVRLAGEGSDDEESDGKSKDEEITYMKQQIAQLQSRILELEKQ